MAYERKDYEDVQSRVKRFQEAFPLGRIVTSIVEFNAATGYLLAKAECYRDDITELPAGADFAFGNVVFYPTHMKRFFVEDTITSAVGRAISLVLPTEFKPTAQDMSRVGQPAQAPKYLPPEAKAVDSTDYWAVESAGAENFGSAVEQLQEHLGAEVLSESPICAHGHMLLREGSKPNKEGIETPFRGFVCPEKKRDLQCKAQWMVISKTTGEWRFQ